MPWYNLRMEGGVACVTGTQAMHLLMSDPSLDSLLWRLHKALALGIDKATGENPDGLMCLVDGNLQLLQWRQQEDCKRFAEAQGRVFPWMGRLRNGAPGSGS